MNRHGYRRGQVNYELESSGLMGKLVSHGFKNTVATAFTTMRDKYEAIEALNNYIDRYDAAHGNKRQTSASVPTQGEDVEFYRAALAMIEAIENAGPVATIGMVVGGPPGCCAAANPRTPCRAPWRWAALAMRSPSALAHRPSRVPPETLVGLPARLSSTR